MSGPGEHALDGTGDPALQAASVKKDTNPKDALGVKKPPLHCLPGRVIFELGLAMLEGARKYGAHNYRESGIRYSVYFDAAMRHLWSAWEGEDIDPDSNLPHIIKAMACLAVLRDGQLAGNYVDDRPIRQPGGLGLKDLTPIVLSLMKMYPDAHFSYTEIERHRVPSPTPPPVPQGPVTATDKIRAGIIEQIKAAASRCRSRVWDGSRGATCVNCPEEYKKVCEELAGIGPAKEDRLVDTEGLVVPAAILRAEGDSSRTLQDVAEQARIEEKKNFCSGCWHVSVCSADLRLTARQTGMCNNKVTC
jgi:hypothetical protein